MIRKIESAIVTIAKFCMFGLAVLAGLYFPVIALMLVMP